jgi:hypothetical protein
VTIEIVRARKESVQKLSPQQLQESCSVVTDPQLTETVPCGRSRI